MVKSKDAKHLDDENLKNKASADKSNGKSAGEVLVKSDDKSNVKSNDKSNVKSNAKSVSKSATKITTNSDANKSAKTGLFATISNFVSGVFGELKQVITPTREQLTEYIIVVLVFVLVIMLFITGIDMAIGQIIMWLFAK